MKENDKLLKVALARNRLIPPLIKSGKVYMERDEKKTRTLRLICKVLVSETNVSGQEYIDEANSFMEGKRLIVVSNHQSDSDHCAKRHALESIGRQDFADKLVYPAGLKMIERPYIGIFIPAEHTVLIPTPFDSQKAGLALEQTHPVEVGKTLVFQSYIENLQRLQRSATLSLFRLQKEGLAVALYPESTRSRNGYLQGAQNEVSAYFSDKGKETFILPMFVDGPKDMLKTEKFGLGRVKIDMRIGEPFRSQDIPFENGYKTRSGIVANRADFVMARIAKLNPGLVEPKYREFYKELGEMR